MKAAFFDVDKTILPGISVERLFFRYLWEKKILRLADVIRFALVLLTPERGLSPVRARANKSYLKGHSVSLIEDIGAVFIQEKVLAHLSPDALQAMEGHRAEGHSVVLATGSPDFLISPLAKTLGIPDHISCRLESAKGVFTGWVIPPHPYAEGKRTMVERFAHARGITLSESYAYSDSPADLPLFRVIGHPRVVNPAQKMQKLATLSGWKVLHWPPPP